MQNRTHTETCRLCFAPKAGESCIGKLWILPQLHQLISCNFAARARAVYEQDQDLVAESPVVTDSRDGAALGSTCHISYMAVNRAPGEDKGAWKEVSLQRTNTTLMGLETEESPAWGKASPLP